VDFVSGPEYGTHLHRLLRLFARPLLFPSCDIGTQCGVGAGMVQEILMGQMLILSGRECRVNPRTLMRCRLDTIACGCSYIRTCYHKLFISFLYLGVCMMMHKGLRIDIAKLIRG